MGAMASQITSVIIIYSSVYSCADQRKRQSSASLGTLCREFIGDGWIPHTKGQQRGQCFHLMTSSWGKTKSSYTLQRLGQIVTKYVIHDRVYIALNLFERPLGCEPLLLWDTVRLHMVIHLTPGTLSVLYNERQVFHSLRVNLPTYCIWQYISPCDTSCVVIRSRSSILWAPVSLHITYVNISHPATPHVLL